MKSKLFKILTLIAITTPCLLSIATLTQSIPAYAATDPVCSSNVAEEVKKAAGCPGYATGDKLPSAVIIILNSIIAISGLVTVVFIIIGGVTYMTSTGDAAKLKKAKDTILYAVIGMIICVLAFAIVNFAITNLFTNATNLNQNNNNSDNQNASQQSETGCTVHQGETRCPNSASQAYCAGWFDVNTGIC